MAPSKSPAVVLLSGGLDSATVLAIAKQAGYATYAISFRYGQKHSGEIARARALAESANVAQHIVVDIDLSVFGGSALTDKSLAVPKSDSVDNIGSEIPITYVPARNTVFLSFALGWAEVLQANNIFIGVNSLDYSGYPDCRPEFIQAYEKMANLATKAGVDYTSKQVGQPIRIQTPLIAMTKAEIIKQGLQLGVDYSKTFSCYDPVIISDEQRDIDRLTFNELACGHCDACLLRLRGFEQNGIADPAAYVR
jgi:7-cyano-7-deazaguanine synthase